jgi:hypothetical protein
VQTAAFTLPLSSAFSGSAPGDLLSLPANGHSLGPRGANALVREQLANQVPPQALRDLYLGLIYNRNVMSHVCLLRLFFRGQKALSCIFWRSRPALLAKLRMDMMPHRPFREVQAHRHRGDAVRLAN